MGLVLLVACVCTARAFSVSLCIVYMVADGCPECFLADAGGCCKKKTGPDRSSACCLEKDEGEKTPKHCGGVDAAAHLLNMHVNIPRRVHDRTAPFLD